MATLKDVAYMAGVDVSTASRALNANNNVSPETRAKVAAAARKLGYKPNIMARALRKGRTHAIGVLAPRLHLSTFSEILLGIERAARVMGYTVQICVTDDEPFIEREHLSRLRNGFVDGIIIVSTGKNTQLLRDIRSEGTAVLQMMRCQDPGISSIVAEYEACAYDAARYLYGRGCRRIGLISGPQELVPFRLRYEGYARAMEELGLEQITCVGKGETTSFEYGYECTNTLLDRNPSLDAVIASVDLQGTGAIRALTERKIRIPDEVRVMSLSGHELGRILQTGMTAMEIPAFEMGTEAVKKVVGDIEAPEGETRSVLHMSFAVTLVEREST